MFVDNATSNVLLSQVAGPSNSGSLVATAAGTQITPSNSDQGIGPSFGSDPLHDITTPIDRELVTYLTWDCFGSNFTEPVPILRNKTSRTLKYWQGSHPAWFTVIKAASRAGFFAMMEIGPGTLSNSSIETLLLKEVYAYFRDNNATLSGK